MYDAIPETHTYLEPYSEEFTVTPAPSQKELGKDICKRWIERRKYKRKKGTKRQRNGNIMQIPKGT